MDIGTLLVVIGVVLAVIDLFVDFGGRFGRASLLTVAMILIGIGVLVGVTPLGD